MNDDIARALRAILAAAPDVQAALARRLGVGPTDVAALDHVISAAGPMGPVELGQRLGIRSASATVLVDRLQAHGHLNRLPDPRDGRRVIVAPTDTARAEVRTALAPLLEAVNAVTSGLSEQEATLVRTFLDDVLAAMREFVR